MIELVAIAWGLILLVAVLMIEHRLARIQKSLQRLLEQGPTP